MLICTVVLLTGFDGEKICYNIVTKPDEEDFSTEPECIYYKKPIAQAIMKALFCNQNRFSFRADEYSVEEEYRIFRAVKKDAYNKYDPNYIPKADFSKTNKPVTVYLSKNRAICMTCKRRGLPMDIENVAAALRTISGTIVNNVNLQYCNRCKKYYIDGNSLKQYDKDYGPLFINRDYSEYGQRSYFFNKDSVLSRYGYTADGSMDTEERQRCITFIIENGFGTKYAIEDHLSNLINRNRQRCPYALPLWEEDLYFVNNYNIERQRYIGEIVIV